MAFTKKYSKINRMMRYFIDIIIYQKIDRKINKKVKKIIESEII